MPRIFLNGTEVSEDQIFNRPKDPMKTKTVKFSVSAPKKATRNEDRRNSHRSFK